MSVRYNKWQTYIQINWTQSVVIPTQVLDSSVRVCEEYVTKCLNACNAYHVIWCHLKAAYERFRSEEQERAQQMKSEEMLEISPQMDYMTTDMNLSAEVRHVLSHNRPKTVSIC